MLPVKFFNRIIRASRWQKRVVSILFDFATLFLAVWCSYYLRIGEWIDPFGNTTWLFFVAPTVSILFFVRMGLYRMILRYMSQDAFVTVFKSVTLSSLVIALLIFWFKTPEQLIPRSVVINYWLLSLLVVGGSRYLVRRLLWALGVMQRLAVVSSGTLKKKGACRIVIYGAGPEGFELLGTIARNRDYEAVAFVDQDQSLSRQIIAGLPVYVPSQLGEVIKLYSIREIFLALPDMTRKERKQIVDSLEHYPVHVRTLPSLSQLTEGKLKLSDIREIDVADLLGRDPVIAQPELMAACITDKVVMVTGGGGSIGAELCRQILAYKPKTLVIYDISEYALYRIQQEVEGLVTSESSIQVESILGSVQNHRRLLKVMSSYDVDTIYHAAAYKHVPIVEGNVAEGIRNNLFGTVVCAQAAISAGVEKFVLISTDKAVRPTNVMGATKRLSELCLKALSAEAKLDDLYDLPDFRGTNNETHFCMVRFGNVLDSSGSVIPKFRQQIKNGGPVTVTHPKITRYFMTMNEAAELVIQAGAISSGGEVYHLDMGEPVTIRNLAEKMIHLSGYELRNDDNPSGDVVIEYTGLRPGEKLYEELLIRKEEAKQTIHPKIYRANDPSMSWPECLGMLKEFKCAIDDANYPMMRDLMQRYVSGYQPQCDLVDSLWRAKQINYEHCIHNTAIEVQFNRKEGPLN